MSLIRLGCIYIAHRPIGVITGHHRQRLTAIGIANYHRARSVIYEQVGIPYAAGLTSVVVRAPRTSERSDTMHRRRTARVVVRFAVPKVRVLCVVVVRRIGAQVISIVVAFTIYPDRDRETQHITAHTHDGIILKLLQILVTRLHRWDE